MSGASYISKWRDEERFWSERKAWLMIGLMLGILPIVIAVTLIFGKLAGSFSGIILMILWAIYGFKDEHQEDNGIE